jgi:mannose-6-phosphate isomerase-like protein (cupin superfamily)
MVIALLLSLLMAQTTSKPATTPQPQPTTTAKPAPTTTKPAPTTTAKPAQPRTPAPRQPAAGALGGFAITVTDSKGMPFEGVMVEMSGVSSESGKTNSAGQISFPRLRGGTYRLRFTGEGVVAFEREVTLKAGDIMKVPITLTAAEPPKPVVVAPPPPPPAPPAPVVGPSGSPQIGSVSDLAENERRAKERREILLSCSGNTRNMLLVLVGEQAQRVYDSAESTFYVLEGQGGAQVGGLMSRISPGSFISVPRGTPFTLARQGNRPLSLLWTLSGEPCEKAR